MADAQLEKKENNNNIPFHRMTGEEPAWKGQTTENNFKEMDKVDRIVIYENLSDESIKHRT